MESNVVSFIMENIFLFLPIGIIGIVVTLYLYMTGKKIETEDKVEVDSNDLKVLKITVNAYVLIYIFIFMMLIIIGLLSNFITPVIIGGALALIPIVLMSIVRWKSSQPWKF